ncbi:uncharacterized protein LOC133193313 [Saccostrea echinata]|uniref:uncharacterized protein LOC133193313 n=1 Tax=Saccostrea echinata TaxID=191078 RepID=UPI002A7FC523|nr:uncharacterized protein LOC133193313 [Saccostrea echinata]
MSKTRKTIQSVFDDAKSPPSKRGVDQQLIKKAEEEFTKLKSHAKLLQESNKDVYEKIKIRVDKMSQRPEKPKDFGTLYDFLVSQNVKDIDVWRKYALLLECPKHKLESSPAKNNKSVVIPASQRKPSSNAGKISTVGPKQGHPSSFPSSNMRQSPGQVEGNANNKEPSQHIRSQTIENGETQQQKQLRVEHMKLIEENEKLKETVREQKQQTEELTTRLSRYASQQLTQGNPNIADLSDKNRPTKIGEKFSLVYDDQWSEAFEALKVGGKTEETVVTELANLVKECYKFSDETKDKMRNELVKRTAEVIRNPLQSSLSTAEEPKDVNLTGSNAIFNDFLKKYGEQSVKSLQKAFRKQKESYTLDKRLTDYLDILVELTWNMVLQDPPMTLNFAKNGEKINEKSFKHYSKKGNVALVCVWPALHLYNGGPIVSKGFILPQ